MKFQQVVVMCLIAIGAGAVIGMMDIDQFGSGDSVTRTSAQEAEIRETFSAGTAMSLTDDTESLMREKAEEIAKILEEKGISSK